jgi:hypothetical protein
MRRRSNCARPWFVVENGKHSTIVVGVRRQVFESCEMIAGTEDKV